MTSSFWRSRKLGVSRGTIRATVLIETIFGAFEMDEILWELREHSAGTQLRTLGLHLQLHQEIPQPCRTSSCPTAPSSPWTSHFLRSYVDLLIQTCHRRGVHAMGGMAAQIPIKNDPAANQAALEKVRQDKLREVWAGHDGTWVAHPGLVSVAREVFDTYMPFPNQIDKKPATESTRHSSADLLTVPDGAITQEGLNRNIDVGLQYLATWLCGNGCVPIYNLMEDAATAEISRAQVWQWIKYEARLSDGQHVTADLVKQVVAAARRTARLSIPGA